MSSTQLGEIRKFLDRYCASPATLIYHFERELRIDTLREYQALCSASDEAECFWLVEEGQPRVVTGTSIARRGPGDIVGEMAFLRGPAGSSPMRGNDIVADCRAKVWKIDRTVLGGLSGETRALWYETVARSLVVKLDEASEQRARQARDLAAGDGIIERLVCPEGVRATTAILLAGAEEIPPVKKTAVIWFSDLAGFSACSENLDAMDAGAATPSCAWTVSVRTAHSSAAFVADHEA